MKVESTARRWVFCLLGVATLSGLVLAKDDPVSVEAAIDEVVSACKRNPGYLAVYHYEAGGKKLECKIGSDAASGLVFLDLNAISDARKTAMRIWNTDDDRLYMETGGKLLTSRGMKAELSSMQELSKKLYSRSYENPVFDVWLVLTKKSVYSGFKLNRFWESSLKGSTLRDMDSQSITFETKEYGALTINRETGILTRQVVQGTVGEARVLELKDYKSNPGTTVIQEASRDWPTLGAKDMNLVGHLAPIRVAVFRKIVEDVAEGKVDLGMLGDTLIEQKQAIRNFAEMCVAKAVDSPVIDHFRTNLIQSKEKMRGIWLKNASAAERENAEENFQKYLNDPRTRKAVTEAVIRTCKTNDREVKLLGAFFGEGAWGGMKTHNESGEAAKRLLAQALVSALLDVMCEHRMNQIWRDSRNLD